MRFQPSIPLLIATLAMASCHAPQSTDSTAIALFNGHDLTGWFPDIPDADDASGIAPSFIARDGMLVSLGLPVGHLITHESYANYKLVVEYRWPGETGNCGVLVHSSTLRRLYKTFPQSLEVQMHAGNAGDFWCIGESICVPNESDRRGGAPDTWGGKEGQSRRILNLTDDSENPPGEWNRLEVICKGDTIHVWVNGDHVNDGFDCTTTKGQIAIQAEGVECEFRKIELTPLKN